MSHFALPDWAEIITDPNKVIGTKVHVQRWNPGAVFILTAYIDGLAYLKSPTRNRRVQTRLPLYRRRHDNA